MLPARKISSESIAFYINNIVASASQQRKSFERRWFDNNFFDDGYHFRYISRTTDRIVDVSDKTAANLPTRAIPKASRQLRGIVNLLLGPDYVPVVYPDKPPKYLDPNIPQDKEILDKIKNDAQNIGYWLTDKWDELNLIEKLTVMLITAGKTSVSYLQIWKDAVEEKIKIQTLDGFDLYLSDGSLTELEEQSAIIKAFPMPIERIKADERFDSSQSELVTPDNKYSTSPVKQAYMQSRYGQNAGNDAVPTAILKEAFIKEYVSKDNEEELRMLFPDIMSSRRVGDVIMRHTFTANDIVLKDEYIDLKTYPFVDFRFEPGAIYQTPIIERFIPANKSLDIAISRIEKWFNTMAVGLWTKRKGENFEISNIPGGGVVEYSGVPPSQVPLSNLPPAGFDFISFLEKVIEEQGASTSALGALPSGVKSGVAIESVKATEFANLKVSSNQLKKTVQRISEKMIEIASDFVTSETVYRIGKDNKPDYFDVLGERGAIVRQTLGLSSSEHTVIKSNYKIKIEVESGLGFTMEGKKQTMQQIINYMMQLANAGLITQDAVKVVTSKFLETYQFGATQEFMDAMESSTMTSQLSQDQLAQIKIAVVQALSDLGLVPNVNTSGRVQPDLRQEQPVLPVDQLDNMDLQGGV